MTQVSVLEGEFFPFVVRPARYLGNEWGSKSYDRTDRMPPLRRVALVVPDKYDRGMCLPELQLCYNYLRSREDIQCERVFLPELDADQLLRDKGIPLFSLETLTPLQDFDDLLILISRELHATVVLSLLDLSQIPLKRSARTADDPRIYAIPTKQVNASLIADFVDRIVTGDILRFFSDLGRSAEPASEPTGKLSWVAMWQDSQFRYPPVLPYEDVIQDRLIVTIPQKYEPERLAKQIREQLEKSGYEEFSLEGDVLKFGEEFRQLCSSLGSQLQGSGTRCLLPPLPPNLLSLEHFEKLSFGRRKSLRILLGAGSEFLREGLGMFFDLNRCFELIANAFAKDWRSIRLNFYVGVPEERESDLQEIADIIEATEELGFEYGEKHSIQVTLEPFIPHPFTSWQWDEILPAKEYCRRIDWIKSRVKRRNVQFRTSDVEMAVIEGLLARGGAELSNVVKAAYEAGARINPGEENFPHELWMKAFSDSGIDISQLASRRDVASPLAEHTLGNSNAQLRKQRENAFPTERRTHSVGGFKLGDIVLARPEIAEQILAPRNEEKRSFGRRPKRMVQTDPMAVPRSRVRLQWTKGERARYIGHLACMKTFERAIRRARIPVEYTQGQLPRQKVSLGPPLALGYTSDAEYFDLHLESPYQEEFLQRLNQELPEGFAVARARPVFGKVTSVSSQINLACYEVDFDVTANISEKDTQGILSRDSIVVSRKRGDEEKEVEVRPAIIDLQISEAKSGGRRLELALGLGNLGFVRPDEVLSHCFHLSEEKVLTLKIHRRALFVVQGERRLSPFEVS